MEAFGESVLIKRLAEPDNMRPQQTRARLAVGEERKWNFVVVSNALARCAAGLPNIAMQFIDILRASHAMETVYVLGDELEPFRAAF